MKYIPGSTFINNTPKFGKYFKRGVTYTLRHINARGKSKGEGIQYIFEVGDSEKTITFKTVEEADKFLSNF